MTERRIPVGCYVKITRKDINIIAKILYVGCGENEIDFVEDIKDALLKTPYVYVMRDIDGYYEYGDSSKNFIPYKELGEMR